MKNVLVIDDSDEIREIISDLLSFEGYSVAMASHPEEAHELIQHTKFDVILCDLVMPIEDGEDCAIVGVHAITKIHRDHPDVPIIAISGNLTGGPLDQMIKFGAKASLSKPFSREQLVQKINSVLCH